ncbi:YcjF family protein [Segnochrobactrum spirostomi]|uniref:TIGR01620 family protein n=1 Tax=Segnochrobactrum spirostomi TaxID=2608987 RepID=A0A6A7Y2B5_9HYPH|nr:TIGR01620 family protein [Segnochrobactrum spirostomi]MQT13190.1 TIGR01620 family protein [Segnochrobactrum spirostomi]
MIGEDTPPRRPAAFRLDEAVMVEAGATERIDPSRPAIEPEPDDDDRPPVVPAKRRGAPWAGLFFTGLGGLASLGIGLSIDRLIEDLFARADWLGWLAAVLAAAAAVGALAIVVREAVAILRLKRIEDLRTRAETAAAADDRAAAETVVADLVRLMRERPETAHGRAALAGHLAEIIDGRDLVGLAERELLEPLDRQARALVTDAAKRVSVVTALSPRAIVDLLFVLASSMALIRRLARLYGGRPGFLGFVTLARHVVGHLAVTGGMAAGDSILHELVGKGIATRISAKLGEGVVNGLMTARVGLAAIDVCRPLPFVATKRLRVSDVVTDIGTFAPGVRNGEG